MSCATCGFTGRLYRPYNRFDPQICQKCAPRPLDNGSPVGYVPFRPDGNCAWSNAAPTDDAVRKMSWERWWSLPENV